LKARHYLRVIVFGLMFVARLSGTTVFQPTFGHPLVYSNRIVFSSVDGKSLIGIDKEGNQKWRIQFPERISVRRWDDAYVLAQSGQEVFQIDVREGAQSKLVTMPESQYLSVDEDDHSLLIATDTRFDHHRVQILDPANYKPIWESSTIEDVIQVTPAMVIAVTAERLTGPHSSYQLKNAVLCAYSRSNGSVRWSLPLEDAYLVTSAVSDHFLVIVESLRAYEYGTGSKRLRVLNPDTGVILSELTGEFDDLSASGDSLTVLEGTFGVPGEARLFTCMLPKCAGGRPGILLRAKEILRFQSYGDYVLTWGVYDAACFSRITGERLWQKGQIDWAAPFGDRMVAADYDRKKSSARIISIDLKTGAQSVLFEQRVAKNDKANLRPF
jgi:hypothetical protein